MISIKRFNKKLKKIKRKGERQKAKYELEEKYAQYYPHKKRKVSNVMLVIIVFAISVYTIANCWITYATGVALDSTLTTCFYTFWGSELVLLAGLKTSKILKGTGDQKDVDDSTCYEEHELGEQEEEV